MKFKNRENEKVGLPDGRVFWNSRSVAVVGTICIHTSPNDIFVLVVKRGHTMDNSGKYCLPCGYMDWDENGYEAFLREVFEESGIYVPDLGTPTFSYLNQPWYVNTSPNENRQNVALHYGSTYIKNELPVINLEELESFSSGEVENVMWMKFEDVFEREFAFGHDQIIKRFVLQNL